MRREKAGMCRWGKGAFRCKNQKKRDGHCPVSFFLKRRRKTERLAGA